MVRLHQLLGALVMSNLWSLWTSEQGLNWRPLSRITVILKGNERILRQSGEMLQSVTYQATYDSTTIRATAPLSPVHQYGKTINSKRMMARKIDSSLIPDIEAAGYRTSTSKKTGDSYVLFGTKVTIPARRFVVITPVIQTQIRDFASNFINDWVTNAPR